MSAFERYIGWIVRHRLLVVLAMLAATAFWASQLPALHVEIDPDANLPQDHPYIRALKTLERTFGEKNLIVVGLFPKDGNIYTPAFLAKVQRITRRIGDVHGLIRSTYLSLASPLVKAIEGDGESMLVRQALEAAPATPAAVAEVRRRIHANPFYVGTVVSADDTATAIIANFKLSSELPGYPEVEQRVSQIVAEENDGTFDVYLGGTVALNAGLARITERTVVLFPIALLMIALLHYEAFRTVQGMVLPVLTAILAVVWSLGLMGFLRIPLDPFNTTTPILILAVAAGHAVQILKRYYEEFERYRDAHVAVRVAVARVGPVMLTAGTIAALSFFSLIAFRTAVIRNFGLLAGFGILATLVIELTLTPALRALLPAPKRDEIAREARSGRAISWALGRLATFVAGHPGAIVATSGIVVVVALAGALRIHVDTTFKRQFPRSHPVRVADDILGRAFSGTNTLVFLVEGPRDGALHDPAALTAIADLQRFVERDRDVGKTLSIVDYLSEMHRAMTGAPAGGVTVPPSADLIGQYLFLYSMSGEPEDLNSQIDVEHRRAAVRVFLRNDSTEYGEHLLERVRAEVARTFPPDFTVRYSGTIASSAALTEAMVRGKVLNMAQIGAIIILVSGLVLRSAIGGLMVAMPLALAVLVNFGVMGLVGIPLDVITSPIAAMAVGIGSDYAVYFLFRFREELATSRTHALALASTMQSSGKAIVYVSSAIAGGYLVLCVSGFVFHIELGALVALAMVVSSLGAITLLPALALLARPAFLFGREASTAPIDRSAGALGEGQRYPERRA
ncbi:MAG: MMPL family transporter [Deltaproteobacteria bacterium]|nr:MMPL family transporter [Deltaproteobacteria bacterium]